jgi:hypothetical protein
MKEYHMAKEKIFCANCQNCIVIRQYESEPDKYVLRVKCTKKKWVKRSGEEKLYKYFTVARRIVDDCDGFIEVGELFPYIKNLRKELPIKDEIYSVRESQ